MKKLVMAGASAATVMMCAGAGRAADADFTTPVKALPAKATGTCDPYKNYSCLDAYLGNDVATRVFPITIKARMGA